MEINCRFITPKKLRISFLVLLFHFTVGYIPLSQPVCHLKSSGVQRKLCKNVKMVLKNFEAPSNEIKSLNKQKPWATKAQEVIDSSRIIAVRLRHILVQSQPMAKICLDQSKDGADFGDLAKSISACSSTRENGGELGLEDEHLDEIFPKNAREAMLAYKPGDMALVETSLGIHLVKVEDVMTELKPTKSRQRSDFWTRTAFPTEKEELKYSMTTLGCQMNVADSERMSGQLETLGYTYTENELEASVVVVNTCSIRDHAEQKVYSFLGPLAKKKQKGEPVSIVVAGCVAQQEGESLVRRIPEIDLVMGPQYANRIGDLLEDVHNGNQVVATEATHIMEDSTKPRRDSSVCAWVNIIYGCNEHCTYCVVPATRGVEQSRPRESIRQEIEELAALGYKEITLLGQNIDAYGRDMIPKQKFADLLHYIHDVEGIERIRFVTSHPRYMSDNVIQAVASLPKLMPCFHIPFQSGDNRILKEMRRGYSVERFLEIVNKIREAIPDASITADAIVGFPGETEDEFQSTLKLMETVQFDQCNTAAYSPRPNTPAAAWENQLAESVKADRLQRINRLQLEHALKRSKRYVGRIEQVLVEERNIKRPEQVLGRTPTNRMVYFDGDIDQLRGEIVQVKITEARPHSLTGEVVE